ncbi:hypothetical protein OS493_025865 [Desmophyllum pertusum]|uniref:CUB domain-containing protein n=1 Tax=Desmophyllum pertusum TaxID=174260 RepID=A0A9W9YXM1_9CNID|nr:hypothetical protein OS493_025865 [Desmophyllum pertusum]
MWVKFHSSPSGVQTWLRGFKARFDVLELRTSPGAKEICFPGNINNNNLELTGSSGTLQSPTEKDRSVNYYPGDSSCDWLITVPDGKIVKLFFDQSFELEPSYGSTCTADYVEVLDGKNNGESKGRYCGFTTPDDIHSSGRYMWVRFRSDSMNSYYNGFKATFVAVDKPSSDMLAIAVVSSGTVFIVLVCCIVCIVRYKRKKQLSSAAGTTMQMPMLTTTTPASYPTQPGAIQYPPPPPPQGPYQPVINPYPPPQVGYAPVPTNPPVPPPEYPYPMQPPPPYPGEEAVPQYPPPGQPYAWQQSAPVKASAPPQSP